MDYIPRKQACALHPTGIGQTHLNLSKVPTYRHCENCEPRSGVAARSNSEQLNDRLFQKIFLYRLLRAATPSPLRLSLAAWARSSRNDGNLGRYLYGTHIRCVCPAGISMSDGV